VLKTNSRPESPAPRRLAVVLSHPIQYYSPWFRELRTHPELEFRVFYLWEFGVSVQRDPQFQKAFQWDVDLLSGYESEFVPNASSRPGADHFWGFHNPGLAGRLGAWRPDALLLFGYKWASHLRAIAWARWHRVPLIFRGDSHRLGRGQPGLLSRGLLRVLYAQFSALLYVGDANRDYFTAYGVPARKLCFAPHAVDPALFNPADPRHLAGAAAERERLGIPPAAQVVLFAGKLIPAKQPRELLAAFLALHRAKAVLIFVGNGEEKPALEEEARRAPPGAVHFLPFANQSEMPARYLLADLFVLPSLGYFETWGLAVNEAMQLGVPALVSDRVGCQRDLVTPGETGWVFRAGDAADLPAQLGRALETLSEPAARDRFRAAVRRRIAGYNYAQTTAGLLRALAIGA
jgi:glycosyltransferase involved in cell wall biosynthesis